jgi:hypothetical protein
VGETLSSIIEVAQLAFDGPATEQTIPRSLLQGMGGCLHLAASLPSLRRGKRLGDLASRQDQQGSRMLLQTLRYGLRVPGFQAASTRLTCRDNQRDGPWSKPQDTARGTTDQRASEPLGKPIPLLDWEQRN